MANICPNGGGQEAKTKGGLGLICKDTLVNLQPDMQRPRKDIQRCTKPLQFKPAPKLGNCACFKQRWSEHRARRLLAKIAYNASFCLSDRILPCLGRIQPCSGTIASASALMGGFFWFKGPFPLTRDYFHAQICLLLNGFGLK